MTQSMISDPKIIKGALEFLKKHNIAVISSVSSAGEPQSSTVYYTVDENFNLYFMTSSNSRKCRNLRENGMVAFVVGTGPEIITVQGGGRAEELDEKEAEVFFKLIEQGILDHTYKWPLLTIAKHGFATFCIKPSWMVWFDLQTNPNPSADHNDFHKII